MKNFALNCALGLIAFFIAFLLAVLVTNDKLGVRIDKSLLPTEAISILNETPNEPLTQDQLKRFNRASENSAAYLSHSRLLFKEISSSWYWFILIPGIVLLHRFIYKKSLQLLDSILIILPSAVLLILVLIGV